MTVFCKHNPTTIMTIIMLATSCSPSLPLANSFLMPPPSRTAFTTTTAANAFASHQQQKQYQPRYPSWPSSTTLFATSETTPPLPDTSDPYIILNLQPTADKSQIKKAYKRMALKYHPDVRTNSDSTEKERKMANDDFARINAAYAFLSGKSSDRPEATASEKSGGGASSSSSGGYGGYTPPHRRSPSERSTRSSASSWEDYMPKYDEEEYDTNGDSFGQIFSDLFSEMASPSSSTVASGAGILNDFISFLEGNFASPGTPQEKEEDIILDSLLRDGTLEEIKDEFDDAKLLVKQLEQKNMDLDADLLAVTKERGDAAGAPSASASGSTFMGDMRLEERKRELEARKEVVEDYLDRARMRQLKLRKRYEELRVDQRGSRGRSSGSSRGASGSGGSYNADRGSRSTASSSSSSSYSASSASSNANANASNKADDDDAWKRESFGSSRRRRGSGRSRTSSRNKAYTSSTGSSEYSSSQQRSRGDERKSASQTGTGASRTYASSPSPPPSSSPSPTESSYSGSSSSEANLPPHRRLTSSRYTRNQEDKRRLREIKVDEEIEKMKKELGL